MVFAILIFYGFTTVALFKYRKENIVTHKEEVQILESYSVINLPPKTSDLINMYLYIIISILLTLEHAYNKDLLTHQYVNNALECLTDELYGNFTVDEYDYKMNEFNK